MAGLEDPKPYTRSFLPVLLGLPYLKPPKPRNSVIQVPINITGYNALINEKRWCECGIGPVQDQVGETVYYKMSTFYARGFELERNLAVRSLRSQ